MRRDKVSVNTGGYKKPSLIAEAAKIYGSQCVVLSVDIKLESGNILYFTAAGHVNTGLDAQDYLNEHRTWARASWSSTA
jgi:cyclase